MLACWHGGHDPKVVCWNLTNFWISWLLPTNNKFSYVNFHIHVRICCLLVLNKFTCKFSHVTLFCNRIENKFASCKTTQDLFARALPHEAILFNWGQRTYLKHCHINIWFSRDPMQQAPSCAWIDVMRIWALQLSLLKQGDNAICCRSQLISCCFI